MVLRFIRRRTTQYTVSLIFLLRGAEMQPCPPISDRLKSPRLTCWLPPHQGNCRNSHPMQCPQRGEVETCKRPRRGGLRAGLSWLPPNSSCSKATFALWDGCIQKTALRLSPSHLEHLKQEEKWSLLSSCFSCQISSKEIKWQTRSPSQRPPLLLGLHTILKAVLHLLAKQITTGVGVTEIFWQRNDTQFPCQGHCSKRQMSPGHRVCQTIFQASYLGLPETVETSWINDNCKIGFVILV